MKKRTKSRWTSEYARQVLARADQSGLTDHAFARQMGIIPQRLWWWRKRLTQPATPPPARAPAFVEVRLPATPPPQPFAVQTRRGPPILVPAGFDAAELRRLLAAVEEREEEGPVSGADLEWLASHTIALVALIQGEIGITDFWKNAHAQEALRGQIFEFLDGNEIVEFDRAEAVAGRLMELARANHDKLTRA